MQLLLIVYIGMGAFVGLALSEGGLKNAQAQDLKVLIYGHLILLALWGIGLYGTMKHKKFLGMDRYLILGLPVLAYVIPAAATYLYLVNT